MLRIYYITAEIIGFFLSMGYSIQAPIFKNDERM